ncbi:MAG: UDP-23-diacylglucosamine hydrolase protein [Nitrosopumilales archaeon]|nr:MAG: UDP-23-diacylglucosamine hydrolase protein [Nitrosopumilales archaeon]
MVQTRLVSSKPALILEGESRNLIVADLHIGFEADLAAKNIFVGKNTTINDMISEICKIIDETKPDSLILLGDVKSSIKSISKNEWDEIPLFFDKVGKKVEIVLIPGNHDSNIQSLVPDGVTLVSSTGLVIENTLLTHGHTLPSNNFSHVDKIIMGHVHPVFFKEDSVLNGQRVWVSIKTEKQKIFSSGSGEIEITIVPSFNKYFYATHKKKYKKSISPIIERVKKKSSAKIVTLDGAVIGNESMISNVL